MCLVSSCTVNLYTPWYIHLTGSRISSIGQTNCTRREAKNNGLVITAEGYFVRHYLSLGHGYEHRHRAEKRASNGQLLVHSTELLWKHISESHAIRAKDLSEIITYSVSPERNVSEMDKGTSKSKTRTTRKTYNCSSLIFAKSTRERAMAWMNDRSEKHKTVELRIAIRLRKTIKSRIKKRQT